MLDAHRIVSHAVSRRAFLVAGGVGLLGLDPRRLAARAAADPPDSRPRRAKTTILIWLCGGASHIDTWDLKPEAPAEFRGEFKPIDTTAPGVRLCEHLPHLAQQAHHLAVINSLGHYGRGTGDHHAGYYYNLTGHAPDQSFRTLGNNRTPRGTDWPFMGATVGFKSPRHPFLPQAITLPQTPGAPQYTRPGQFAAMLGVEHDPLYVMGDLEHPTEFTVPALVLQGDVTPERLQSRRELLGAIDAAARSVDAISSGTVYAKHQAKAFSLLGSAAAKDAFQVGSESESVRSRYGNTVNGMSMLMARRLSEAEVPFVTVFWKEDLKRAEANKCKSAGGWDTHGNNFHCLRETLLPEFDLAFSALVEDLAQRGLLDQTLVMINSEMGRKPKIGDPRSGGGGGAGRDHWTNCMSVLLAGGGVRGGQTYGTSDRVAAYPDDRPVAPEDIAQTVYHAMGIDDLTAVDVQGRPIRLLDDGHVLADLF